MNRLDPPRWAARKGHVILDKEQITILMGTYNGAAHLPAQLRSIAGQTHRNWQLRWRDDGSRDASPAILRSFARHFPGQVSGWQGPRLGFAANYLQMLRDLPERPGWVALADQDDIWMPGKLARALHCLKGRDKVPALYCGRRWYWQPGQSRCRASPPAPRGGEFRNALIENIAAGNTIVLNPAAARLARLAAMRVRTGIFAHDWWLYLLITGVGGQIHFDAGPPQLHYRQHGANALGAACGIAAQIRRKRAVLSGSFARRLRGNLRAMGALDDLLTPENRQILRQFDRACNAPLLNRLRLLRQVRPYRQSGLGDLGFWGAAGLGRI